MYGGEPKYWWDERYRARNLSLMAVRRAERDYRANIPNTRGSADHRLLRALLTLNQYEAEVFVT